MPIEARSSEPRARTEDRRFARVVCFSPPPARAEASPPSLASSSRASRACRREPFFSACDPLGRKWRTSRVQDLQANSREEQLGRPLDQREPEGHVALRVDAVGDLVLAQAVLRCGRRRRARKVERLDGRRALTNAPGEDAAVRSHLGYIPRPRDRQHRHAVLPEARTVASHDILPLRPHLTELSPPRRLNVVPVSVRLDPAAAALPRRRRRQHQRRHDHQHAPAHHQTRPRPTALARTATTAAAARTVSAPACVSARRPARARSRTRRRATARREQRRSAPAPLRAAPCACSLTHETTSDGETGAAP